MILRTVVGVGVGAVGGVLIGVAVLLARHLIKPFAFVGWGNLGWPAPLLTAALVMPLPGAIVGAAVGASGVGAAYGAVVGAATGVAYIVAANFRRLSISDKSLWEVSATFALTHGLAGAGVAACLGGLFPR